MGRSVEYCHDDGTFPLDRRALIAGLIATAGVAQTPALAVQTSAVRWPGANGRSLYGFMAIPGTARRQPAVLVVAGARALPSVPDPVARTIVREIAAGGLLACTADNITGVADLRTLIAWLRGNRYGTGKVALVGAGSGAPIAEKMLVDAGGGIATAETVATAEGSAIAALLLLGQPHNVTTGQPTLALDWRPGDPALPPGAIPFLKEHLG